MEPSDPARARPADARRGALRVGGLGVLSGIVLLGLVTGAGFYRFTRGRQEARLAAELEQAPRTQEGLLALWLCSVGGPQIHHRLTQVGRLSSVRPWLVTHALARSAGTEVELWGIDCSTLPRELAHIEGSRVVVALPAPRALGPEHLDGEEKNRVPLYAEAARPDAARHLGELALYLLDEIPAALARDVPGAEIEIRVAPE